MYIHDEMVVWLKEVALFSSHYHIEILDRVAGIVAEVSVTLVAVGIRIRACLVSLLTSNCSALANSDFVAFVGELREALALHFGHG